MEGLQMMSVESQARFILPPALSFGTHEWPEGVDQGTPLLFFVTLHEVSGAEASP
jgi:FKBP-type peptidyl-prolyl cis-trans isomerase